MVNKLFRHPSLNTDLAALILRILFGGMFIYYGYLKIQGYDMYMPMMKDYIGLGGKLSYNLVIAAEFFCGFLILIGFLTRWAILPIAFSMVIVFFVAHANDNFLVKNLPLVYLLLCPVIFLLGSGRFSVDALMPWNRRLLTKK
jgi:putative oxidoreductase